MLLGVTHCQFHQQESLEAGAPNQKTGPDDISPLMALRETMAPRQTEYVRVVGSEDGGNGLIAELDTSVCSKIPPPPPQNQNTPNPSAANAYQAQIQEIQMRTYIVSPFGREPITFTLSLSNTEPQVQIAFENGGLRRPGQGTIRDQIVRFSHNWTPDWNWLQQACHTYATQGANAQFKGTRTLVAAIAAWSEQIVPDCEFREVIDNGWHCRLPLLEPELAVREIERIKKTMISSWSRQPYILTRRVTVTLNLANSMSAPAAAAVRVKSLDRMCRVISKSLPLELPLIMANKTWQNGFCTGELAQREEAALLGLNKAFGEIEFLRRLFENTSKLGVLAVRIPKHLVPSPSILVSLRPGEDVASNLARETTSLWQQATSDRQYGQGRSPWNALGTLRGERMSVACWHPIFALSPTELSLARYLDLAGDAPGSTCTTAPNIASNPADTSLNPAHASASSVTSADKYLASSITSDSEFIINNGQSQVLRLPMGSYSYTLQALPQNPIEFEEEAGTLGPTASGTIEWDSRRPRPVIRSW